MLADAARALLAIAGLLVLLAGWVWLVRRSGPTAALGPIELAGRLFLEPRRTIYLIRVHDRVLIVGGSEAGLTKLGELPGETVPPLPHDTSRLRQLLRSVRAQRPGAPLGDVLAGEQPTREPHDEGRG